MPSGLVRVARAVQCLHGSYGGRILCLVCPHLRGYKEQTVMAECSAFCCFFFFFFFNCCVHYFLITNSTLENS